MSTSAHLPISADRYITCVRKIRVRGIDLSGAPMRLQVRLAPDTPGTPLVNLSTVTVAGAEGLRFLGVENDGGVLVSTLEMVVSETTMRSLPYAGELGDSTVLSYDWLVTIGDYRRRFSYGSFIVIAGVSDADGAPINRPVGRAISAGSACWSIADLTFGPQTYEVSLAGVDLLASITAEARAASDEAVEAAAQFRQTVGGVVNMFDKTAVRVGFEVQFSGAVIAEANSVASAPMYVGDVSEIVVSGLSPNVNIGAGPLPGRVWAAYSALPIGADTCVGNGQLGTDAVSAVTLPAGANYFCFSPKQRDPGSVPYDLVQVQSGSVPTAFEPYEEAVLALNLRPIGRRIADASGTLNPIEMIALFGDSITEVTDADNGQYVPGSGYRSNWPDYALPTLRPMQARSFARREASFATRSGTVVMQRFDGQITAALASNITPNVIVVALGINDLRFLGFGALGTFEDAMAKAYADLDMAVPIEAARKGFYRLQQAWPDAVKFVSFPLQTAPAVQLSYSNIRAWSDLIGRMAARYGFTIIDCCGESGIVTDFEVSSGQGRDLSDGLHPDASGQSKQGKLIAARIRGRLGT